jgi:hypothetical protein
MILSEFLTKLTRKRERSIEQQTVILYYKLTSMKSGFLAILILMASTVSTNLIAQRVLISEPDKEDSRKMNFEIIGKIGENLLVFKNIRSDNFICIYDNNMKQIGKVQHTFLEDERLINVNFFAYPNFFYVIYEFQKRNIVYCKAVKLDAMGKRLTDPIDVDTTNIGGSGNNKIYTIITSEDKQKIMIFKINSRNRTKFLLTTILFNDKLELLKKTVMNMAMDEFDAHLGEFSVDNDGNLIFAKFYQSNNESISEAYLVVKKANENSFTDYKLNLDKIYLDELRLKVDNNNHRYLLNAFYYKQKRGNIEGLYTLALNKSTWLPDFEKTFVFSEDLRRDAKGDANLRMAFNDYFIRNIIVKRDGGFLLDAEAYYTSSRSNGWNRWDYMYSSPYSNAMDYYSYNPYYSNMGWRGDYANQSVRYHADNMIILSFDKNGELMWNNAIEKGQFDDESGDKISYQVVNTGSQLHFLFNQQEKKHVLLNDYTLIPGGQITKNPTLKNLDQGHEFMPKFGKQISAKQFIVPCFYRNYICFAKIDYN